MPIAVKRKRRMARVRPSNNRPVTVYARGRIHQAKAGQRAGDFGPAGFDFVVKPAHGGWKLVGSNYRLQAGDTLTVTTRAVAGSGRPAVYASFGRVASGSIAKNREVLLALAKL